MIRTLALDLQLGPEKRRGGECKKVKKIEKIVVSGDPDEEDMTTSGVERLNLTARMLNRRFNRLTNAHSKDLRNHCAFFDLVVAYYNFCWIHGSINETPAIGAGVAQKPWSIDRLVREGRRLSRPDEPPTRPGNAKYTRWLRDRQRGNHRRQR